MTKSDKILTPEYLNWHAKLSGLPNVLADKIRSNLYKIDPNDRHYLLLYLLPIRLTNRHNS